MKRPLFKRVGNTWYIKISKIAYTDIKSFLVKDLATFIVIFLFLLIYLLKYLYNGG